MAVLTMTNDVYFSKSYFNTDGMSWAHHFLFWNVYTVNGWSYTILFCLFLFCVYIFFGEKVNLIISLFRTLYLITDWKERSTQMKYFLIENINFWVVCEKNPIFWSLKSLRKKNPNRLLFINFKLPTQKFPSLIEPNTKKRKEKKHLFL